MRIPGAATLILLGLLILWLATTGKLDRLWKALGTDTPAATVPGVAAASATTAVNTVQVLDAASYHYGTMLDTLTPGLALDHPGGMV